MKMGLGMVIGMEGTIWGEIGEDVQDYGGNTSEEDGDAMHIGGPHDAPV